MILENHVIKVPYEKELLMVSHHPAKFDGHRHCGSGNMNIPANTILLQRRISVTVYARLFLLLLFFVKHVACHVSHASQSTAKATVLLVIQG